MWFREQTSKAVVEADVSPGPTWDEVAGPEQPPVVDDPEPVTGDPTPAPKATSKEA
jgi:hypothetical protein